METRHEYARRDEAPLRPQGNGEVAVIWEQPELEQPRGRTPRTERRMAKIQWDEETATMTRIKVIGVGGGGCNAVEDMVSKSFGGVDFFVINTDFQALQRCQVGNKIQIGEEITHGLGAGAIPELGEEAARAHEAELKAALEGADMVFITAGMGGGTGTGAAPVVAEYAKEMGILSVAIVTKPFTFEGPQRMRRAEAGIRRLKENVDTMIVIMNDKLMETVGPKTPLTEAFQIANSVLAQGIRAISDLISMPGLINVDFRDVRTIMGETGGAVMGVGVGKGENRAVEAVRKACHSPLQEKIVIDGARGVLMNITGGPDVTMHEITEATSLIYESADPEANIIFGVVIDESMRDEMRVTIIATGFAESMESNVSGFTPGAARPRRSMSSLHERPSEGREDREHDPTPAITRKKEREQSQAQPATVDFNRPDNPLKAWEKPAEREAPAPGGHTSSVTRAIEARSASQATEETTRREEAPRREAAGPAAVERVDRESARETAHRAGEAGGRAAESTGRFSFGRTSGEPTRTVFPQRPTTPAEPASGSVLRDSTDEAAARDDEHAESDPFDIPALERRRKPRFFE
ncbi:MAG: Cell division protein FtsZ [candidate division BRC1 bacterium ADurb.BinA292]|nr:MAG: Cell division protein FtsZ [candidate division BRC1 bacterium ADurb.BinA292]